MSPPCDKVAGLMSSRWNPEKSFKHEDGLAHLCACCDLVFFLDDRSDPPIPAQEWFKKYPNLQTIIRLDERDEQPWNEWTYRCQLLAAAAKYHCTHVIWLDDDESIFPSPDRAMIGTLVNQMKSNPTAVVIESPWRNVWNEPGQIRVDGWWGRTRKPLIQKNPLFISGCICFTNNALHRLHCWPVQRGSTLTVDSPTILHYGMMTEADRKRWREKYEKEDPDSDFAQDAAKELNKDETEILIQKL